MILRELFYFDKETLEPENDKSYEPEYDQSPIEASDTRQTRLTLGQLNRIRKSSEYHQEQEREDQEFVKQMYAASGEEEAI